MVDTVLTLALSNDLFSKKLDVLLREIIIEVRPTDQIICMHTLEVNRHKCEMR